MKPMFSLAYLTVSGVSPAGQIQIAAECGYDGVGLRPISMKLPGEPDFPLSDAKRFETVKQALDETGMRLFNIELAKIMDGADVRSYEPELAAAARLGAQYVITSIWTDDKERAAEQLGRLCDMADGYGLLVNLEYMPFASVRTLSETLAVIEALKRPGLRVMIDILHAYRAGTTPEALGKVPKELFGFVHLCDGPSFIPPADHPDMTGVARGRREYLGEGGIDAASLIKAIPEIPYYEIEIPHTEHLEAYGRTGHAKRCLETAEAYLKKHGLWDTGRKGE